MAKDPLAFEALSRLVPKVPVNPAIEQFRLQTSGAMAKALLEEIKAFEEGLKPDEETGAILAQFGTTITITLESVEARGVTVIALHGTNSNGERCVLVQHMSQVNILLMAVKAAHAPARRIGFVQAPATEEG